MEYRSYRKSDKIRVIEIFYSNCPKYFRKNDLAELDYFLENFADENYLVAVKNNSVIGAGGHYTKSNYHGIAWVMFERGSLGSKNLLQVAKDFYNEIENRILAEKRHFDIQINTTQIMESLFNSFGFTTYNKKEDGFGKGLDEYKMINSKLRLK